MTGPVTVEHRRRIWTEAEIRALGVRIDGVLAVEIVTGYAKDSAYNLLKTPDALPFRVLKVGRRYVVPAADVLRVLGLEPGLAIQPGLPNTDATDP